MKAATLVALVALLAVTALCVAGVSGRRRTSRRWREDSGAQVTFSRYMAYSEVTAYLRSLQQRFPARVRVGSAGSSVEGRQLWYAHVSSGGSGNPIMLVDSLMHAREWITLPATLYFLQQAVEAAALPSGLDVVVLPILNPDGYEYSRTTDRLWRKNRAPTVNKTCTGVDLNRNFDFHWADFIKLGDGASDDPCSLNYAGPRPASEPETQGYQAFVRALNADKRVKMYVNLHSPEQSIYTPWGYDTKAPAVVDIKQLTAIGNEANAALVKAGSQAYTVESTAADYPATGTVSDWVRGVAGVAQSFCVELPPGGSDADEGFAVPTSSILPVAQQVFQALRVFAKYAQAPLSQ